MRNWATRALLAVLSVGALPVMATPPRTIEIRDRLFARNSETLFLIRETLDNHGLHGVTQTDTLLVFRSLAGGDDRGFQGVARVVDRGPDGDPRVETLPLASPANPYDLFSDFDAWPLQAPRFRDPSAVSLSGEGLQLDGFGTAGPLQFALPLDDLTLRLQDSLSASLHLLPPHTVGGGSIGPHPFDPAAIDILRDCTVSNHLVLHDAETDPALVQLTCEIEDGLGGAQLWFVVPQV
jgi:hypothetical protein